MKTKISTSDMLEYSNKGIPSGFENEKDDKFTSFEISEACVLTLLSLLNIIYQQNSMNSELSDIKVFLTQSDK
jgi:hypothetical protein